MSDSDLDKKKSVVGSEHFSTNIRTPQTAQTSSNCGRAVAAPPLQNASRTLPPGTGLIASSPPAPAGVAQEPDGCRAEGLALGLGAPPPCLSVGSLVGVESLEGVSVRWVSRRMRGDQGRSGASMSVIKRVPRRVPKEKKRILSEFGCVWARSFDVAMRSSLPPDLLRLFGPTLGQPKT